MILVCCSKHERSCPMKFQPGHSGNPGGRPPGARNKKTLALEAAYEAKAEEAVNDIMERAKSGDPAAMRLCMERSVPTGRHRRVCLCAAEDPDARGRRGGGRR